MGMPDGDLSRGERGWGRNVPCKRSCGDPCCWGPSSFEGPQKHDLTIFWSIIHEQVSSDSDQNHNLKKYK
jgi:hypothetical protein